MKLKILPFSDYIDLALKIIRHIVKMVYIEDVQVNANLRWSCEEEKNTYK